jgi:hypothetical protein
MRTPCADVSLLALSPPSTSDLANPRYIDSVFGKKGAVTDSFLPFGTENGQPKFLASFMGDRKGLSPGKLAEVAYVNEKDKWEVVAEHEGGVDGAADPSFTPHGFVSGWSGNNRLDRHSDDTSNGLINASFGIFGSFALREGGEGNLHG